MLSLSSDPLPYADRKKLIMNAGRVSLLIITLAFCFSLADKGWAGNFPVIGIDPIENLSIIENHSEILESWGRQGLRDVLLMNFDAHDDMRWICPEQIEKLRALHRAGDWEAVKKADSVGDESLYDTGSFIYAAAQLGMVKGVYWVIPFAFLSHPKGDTELRAFLRAYEFPEEDIRRFRMQEGRFCGVLRGIPVTICDLYALPDIEAPLVLSIDLDFLAPFAKAHGLNKLSAVRSLLGAIFRKKYGVQDALMAYSINGGYLSALNRWIGDPCEAILREPDLKDALAPRLWRIWRQLDNAYEANDPDGILKIALANADVCGKDPNVLLYTAFAHYAKGDLTKAFNDAEGACRIDSKYCYGLADIGQCLIDTRRLPKALKFFDAAYALKPDMNFRQKNLADALKMAGRYNEALTYYEIYQSWNGSFPVQFQIADTYRLMGDEESALKHFMNALKCLQKNPSASVWHPIDAEAIFAAITFFERKGLATRAEELREYPAVKMIIQERDSGAGQ